MPFVREKGEKGPLLTKTLGVAFCNISAVHLPFIFQFVFQHCLRSTQVLYFIKIMCLVLSLSIVLYGPCYPETGLCMVTHVHVLQYNYNWYTNSDNTLHQTLPVKLLSWSRQQLACMIILINGLNILQINCTSTAQFGTDPSSQ